MELPALLRQLIAVGRWPDSPARPGGGIAVDVARRWDPESDGIHLLSKPTPLDEELRGAPGLRELWNVADVDPDRCLVIADFGIGTDNPIVLDFTTVPPSVRTQRWPKDGTSRPDWITIATTFDQFAADLGLTE